MKKTYTVTLDNENQKSSLHRVNDGFNALELLGLTVVLQNDILSQMNGIIRPDVIVRQVVRDSSNKMEQARAGSASPGSAGCASGSEAT